MRNLGLTEKGLAKLLLLLKYLLVVMKTFGN
jgi:hypothetical protein